MDSWLLVNNIWWVHCLVLWRACAEISCTFLCLSVFAVTWWSWFGVKLCCFHSVVCIEERQVHAGTILVFAVKQHSQFPAAFRHHLNVNALVKQEGVLSLHLQGIGVCWVKEKHDFLKWRLGNQLIDRCFESSRLKLKKMKRDEGGR